MRLSDFIILDEEEKKLAVIHCGILVAKRKTSTHFFFLFQMENFYAETRCHIGDKRIQGYKMYHHVKHLEFYLDTIAIDDLLR